MSLLLPALLPWMAAALAPFLRRKGAAFALVGGVALGLCVALAAEAPAVWRGQVLTQSWPWLPGLGASFTLRLDALGLLFALLLTGIGALVALYAYYYLHGDARQPRFYALLAGFIGAMLLLVMAGDLVLLALAWELTSLASFALIAFNAPERTATRGARSALAVTAIGGLALMLGVLLLARVAGAWDLAMVLSRGAEIRADASYPWILGCVLLAAFTKSAQFPFHFWLPRAMAAPTPVSAYLHSATLVKAGIFLLLRFYPVLSGTELWFYALCLAGATSLLLGAVAAIFQHDVKGLLAYSTVSHLGLMTLLLGFATPTAVVAAVFHLINHACFKASLFMAAGIIDHECGTRDLRRVNGMARYMPLTATLAISAAAAMAGVPLFNGFLSKEMFFAESLAVAAHRPLSWLLPVAALAAAVAGVAYSARFIHDVFFNGEPVNLPRQPHEPPRWMRAPVALLVTLCVALGVVPNLVLGESLDGAVRAVLQGPAPSYSLALWHGWSPPLLMSGIGFTLGLALYAWLMRGQGLHARPAPKASGFALLMGGLHLLARLGRACARRLRSGSLSSQLSVLALLAVLAAASPLLGSVMTHRLPALPQAPVPNLALAVWGLGVVCALAVLNARFSAVTRLLFLGAVGLVVAMSFAALSAPDLALTQLFVEVATVLLLLLALRRLPQEAPPPAHWTWRARALGLAVAGGAGVGYLAWAAMQRRPEAIANYHLAHSLSEGGGRNVVNVIIVDFRGFDTLGEITVLAAAALIVQHWLQREREGGLTRQFRDSFMLPSAVRVLLPFCAMVAAYLYLRGHNEPGGGFVAGLVLALGLALEALALGTWRSPHARPLRWLAAGLGLCALTGVAAMLLGHAFLRSAVAHPQLPWIGELPLASAALFDLGVFAVVVGATLALVLAFAFCRGGRAE